MKLIEILARELEEWPEGVERITQDSDGELNKVKDGEDPHLLGGYTDWASGACYALTNKEGRWVSVTVAEDQVTAIVTREQWQEARRELNEHSHEVTPQWRGPQDGMPPVGTHCEVKWGNGWRECVVLPGHWVAAGVPPLLSSTKRPDGWTTNARVRGPDDFRALRTCRDRAIDTLADKLESNIPVDSKGCRVIAEYLIDEDMVK